MIAAVPESAMNFATGVGARTIRETILHLFACQSTVLSGLSTGVFPWKQEAARFDTMSADVALEIARDIDASFVQLVREAEDSWFSEVPAGYSLERRQWLWESLEHEIHHTGQLAILIRMAGGEPARIFE